MATIAKTSAALLILLASTAGTLAQASGSAQCAEPQGGNLSQKLNQSNGVICPPQQVDPGMKQSPANKGAMPVIPPPGSPGGDPNVQPK